MIISRTTQYAIQAMIYMATQPPFTPVLNKKVAAVLNIPAPYLSKILPILARVNLLYSFRGRTGGFYLREDGGNITLMEIIEQTEGPNFTRRCVLGHKQCSDETACPLHHRWSPVKEKVMELLRATTLNELAAAVESGKYRLVDLPGEVYTRLSA